MEKPTIKEDLSSSSINFTDIHGQPKQMRKVNERLRRFAHTGDNRYFLNSKNEVMFHPIAKAVKQTTHQIR